MTFGGGEIVQRLAGVLFEMQTLDANGDALRRRHIDDHFALADDRMLELRNLIALRQVGIEIILAIENRPMVDLRLQAQSGAHRLADAFLIDHRQHTRHGRIDERNMIVRRAAIFRRGAGKELGVARHLRMDFHTDDDFPVAGRAFDEFGGSRMRHNIILGSAAAFWPDINQSAL